MTNFIDAEYAQSVFWFHEMGVQFDAIFIPSIISILQVAL